MIVRLPNRKNKKKTCKPYVCRFTWFPKRNPGEYLPYAPAPRTPTMSTHTMTGAVNLSSSRNSMLTNMAISRPLRPRKGAGETSYKED